MTDRSGMLPGLQRGLVGPGSSWEGILTIEQHWAPPEDVPEYCFPMHTVALRLSPSFAVEWGIAGEKLRRATVPTGSLGLVTKGASLRWRRHQKSEGLVAALDPEFVATVANRSRHGDPVEFRTLAVFQDPALAHILLALQAESQQSCAAGRLYAESLATALATHLLQHYAVFAAGIGAHKGGLPPARLRRVLDYIDEHLGEDTTLRQLAQIAQLSPNHFATAFKQSTGLPPHRYVLQRRIARAREMLADRRLSLAEIAYLLGFPSQAHFTTMFRKVVGNTPGAYREGARTQGRCAARSPAIAEEMRNPPPENRKTSPDRAA